MLTQGFKSLNWRIINFVVGRYAIMRRHASEMNDNMEFIRVCESSANAGVSTSQIIHGLNLLFSISVCSIYRTAEMPPRQHNRDGFSWANPG